MDVIAHYNIPAALTPRKCGEAEFAQNRFRHGEEKNIFH
jgi:hypothetical protein